MDKEMLMTKTLRAVGIFEKEAIFLNSKNPNMPLPPKVVILYDDQTVWAGHASAMTKEAIVDIGVPIGEVIRRSVEAHHGSLPEPRPHLRGLIVVVEGLGRPGKPPECYERGDFAKDLAENPNSDVRHVLCCYLFEDNLVGGANANIAVVEYTVDDGGYLAWGPEHIECDVEAEGVLMDQVNDLFLHLGSLS